MMLRVYVLHDSVWILSGFFGFFSQTKKPACEVNWELEVDRRCDCEHFSALVRLWFCDEVATCLGRHPALAL